MAVCQGKSLACAFDMKGINSIITTTAYVLTPIVAIIGFVSWKVQYNIQLEKNDLKKVLEAIIVLKENIQYFDIHLNDLYLEIGKNRINSFEVLLPHYLEDKNELIQKRRELSINTLRYYSSIDLYSHNLPEKKIDLIYDLNNSYIRLLDNMCDYFEKNNVQNFLHFFQNFHSVSNDLTKEIKEQIEILKDSLKL
ncbi:hypothetical protein [Acinetobacter terrae]|uniref:hypothetical protein n=1 Tax=Acinetobacter terrae TaxID=2731247 RepID=UPI001177D2AF|nr:hypothetical protein [Acinetobacter terrae]